MTYRERVEIGPHVLYLGDCRDVLPILSPVDLVVADPPYSISVEGSENQSDAGTRSLDFFECDRDWGRMTATVVEALASVAMTATASAYVWCGHRQIGAIVAHFEKARPMTTRLVAWEKACPAPAPPWSGWPSGFETCVYAYPEGRVWDLAPGQMPRSNLLRADSFRHGQPGKVDHPTQKPLAVIEPLIRASSRRDQTVLDPFMGSGTTGVACANLGRRFVGVEIHEPYFRIACRRIADAVAGGVQPSLFPADVPSEPSTARPGVRDGDEEQPPRVVGPARGTRVVEGGLFDQQLNGAKA